MPDYGSSNYIHQPHLYDSELPLTEEEQELEDNIYNYYIPRLEQEKIYLSYHHETHRVTDKPGTLSMESYNELKDKKELFNIKRIYFALTVIDEHFAKSNKLSKLTSRELRPIIEAAQHEAYITKGDFTLAMIIKGFKYSFKYKKIFTGRARFYCKIITPLIKVADLTYRLPSPQRQL